MSVKITVPLYLQPLTDNTEVIEVSGSTVGECLDQLVKQFPRMEKMLFDKKGNLFGYAAIYVNGEDVYPDELLHSVEDGDELYILYIIGGG